MSLNQEALNQLTGLGFSQQDIQRLINNPFLLDQTNEFKRNGGDFLSTPQGTNQAYALNGNIYFTPNSNYTKYNVLAHELGHALGTQQSTNLPSDYFTSKEYAYSRGIGEAEAIFNEYQVIQAEIHANGSAVSTSMTRNLYSDINAMSGQSNQVILDFLAKKNMHEMNPSTNPQFTYYQNDIWTYLSRLSDITSDSQEVLGISLDSSTNLNKIITMIDYDLFGENGNDTIDAIGSVDRIRSIDPSRGTTLNGSAFMYGGAGNDTLTGTNFSDIIIGGKGNDTLKGMDGDDKIGGNSGNDTIYGGIGNDTLIGGKDADTIYGDEDNDTIILGMGSINDSKSTIESLASTDTNKNYGEGGEGNDTIYGSNGNDTIYTGTNDVNSDVGTTNTAYGFDGDDIIKGAAGKDTLYGGEGGDDLFGKGGDDVLYGNDGLDTLLGGEGNDSLYGGDAKDVLSGWTGNDNLHGENGDDTLRGGDDDDILKGGEGDDCSGQVFLDSI